MNDSESTIDPPDPEMRPTGLSAQQLEQLRAAGGWSRFIGITGIVLCALLLIGFLAVVRLRPGVIARIGGDASASLFISLLLSAAASLVAATLLLGFGSNVAAHLRREAGALTRGFRQLRFYFVLWTVLSGLRIAYEFLSAWRKF